VNHYVYIVTHRPSGRYYVGVRSCKSAPAEDTRYMGSGPVIRALIAKHGRHEFEKDILESFPSREEAAAFEAFLIDRDVIEEPDCLNLQTGGEGWGTGLHAIEVRKKISAANRLRYKHLAARAKTGAASKEAWANASPEQRAARIERVAKKSRRLAKDPTFRQKLSEATVRRYQDRSQRARSGVAAKSVWDKATPEQRAARVAAAAEGQRRARANRERVKREVALIFFALINQRCAA